MLMFWGGGLRLVCNNVQCNGFHNFCVSQNLKGWLYLYVQKIAFVSSDISLVLLLIQFVTSGCHQSTGRYLAFTGKDTFKSDTFERSTTILMLAYFSQMFHLQSAFLLLPKLYWQMTVMMIIQSSWSQKTHGFCDSCLSSSSFSRLTKTFAVSLIRNSQNVTTTHKVWGSRQLFLVVVFVVKGKNCLKCTVTKKIIHTLISTCGIL